MKKLLTLLLLLFVITTGCTKDEKKAAERNPAPDFTLTSLKGETVKLSDLRGKVVLLNFWATWCPPCREEIPSLMKLNEAMAGKPFVMICASIDEGGKAAIESFFSKSGTYLPTFLDTNQAVSKRYGLTGVPETFVIDGNGVIIKKIVGGLDWHSPQVVGFLNTQLSQLK